MILSRGFEGTNGLTFDRLQVVDGVQIESVREAQNTVMELLPRAFLNFNFHHQGSGCKGSTGHRCGVDVVFLRETSTNATRCRTVEMIECKAGGHQYVQPLNHGTYELALWGAPDMLETLSSLLSP